MRRHAVAPPRAAGSKVAVADAAIAGRREKGSRAQKLGCDKRPRGLLLCVHYSACHVPM